MLSSATIALVLGPSTVASVLDESGAGIMGTFDELATIYLARCDFECYDMILGRSCELVSTLEQDVLFVLFRVHTWASLRSFIGIPMVLVMIAGQARERKGVSIILYSINAEQWST